MGRSPGKWLKTLLFQKKSPKPKFPKKTASEKKAELAAKTPSSDLFISSPLIPDPAVESANERRENTGSTEGTANLPNDRVVVLPGSQDINTEGTTRLGSPNHAAIALQEQAVMKIQAVYRGYLARRAFWALKGIIRLQAVVRGHLVRRQAIATLHCVRGIVKLQALIRGHKVRLTDVGIEVQRRCSLEKASEAEVVNYVGVSRYSQSDSEKLSANVFVTKLLASLSAPIPLHLQYDSVNSTSAWSWLDRWSSSRFWEPLAKPKKDHGLKSKRKLANNKVLESEQGRLKRGVRKASTSNSDNSLASISEYGRPKQGLKKPSSFQSDSVEDNLQNELERVKRNLRKVTVSSSSTDADDGSEVVTEKSKQCSKKVSKLLAPDVLEQASIDTPEKFNDLTITVSKESETYTAGKVLDPLNPDFSEQFIADFPEKPSDLTVTVSKEPEMNAPSKPWSVNDEPADVLCHDHSAMKAPLLDTGDKDDNIPLMIGEFVKEDRSSKDNHRIRRRKSLPLSQDNAENVSQNTPTVPSYMAPTKSAKAKARGQGSPRLSHDGAENVYFRRHSLPSPPASGKLSTPSPRVQRLAQASGKGGTQTDKALSTSRDGHEKAEWRR